MPPEFVVQEILEVPEDTSLTPEQTILPMPTFGSSENDVGGSHGGNS
jgi:hypothetical protein